MSAPRHVRKQLIIPAEIDQRLAAIAVDTGTTSSEVVRKAITLYIIATEKKQQGLKLGFARSDQTLETEVIGLSEHSLSRQISNCQSQCTGDLLFAESGLVNGFS